MISYYYHKFKMLCLKFKGGCCTCQMGVGWERVCKDLHVTVSTCYTTVFSAGMRHHITIYPAEFWLTSAFSTPPGCAHLFFRHVPVCQRTCSTQHLPLGSLICNDGGHSFQDYIYIYIYIRVSGSSWSQSRCWRASVFFI